jgi:hypothetical protein
VAHNPVTRKGEQSVSSENVAQEPITSERNTYVLDPNKGAHGLLGIQEAVQVALRRVGTLIAALSHREPMRPCMTEENQNETIRAELAEDGRTAQEISDRTRIPYSTVSATLKRAGIQAKPGDKGKGVRKVCFDTAA